MADDTTGQSLHRDLLGPDLDALLDEATGAFLESWSPDPDGAAPSDATEVVKLSDVERSVDVSDSSPFLDPNEVFEMASSVIFDLLDGELQSSSSETTTFDALHDALSPELVPSMEKSAKPAVADATQEIEILDEDDLEDPFDATGIEFIDVDTGERLGADVPYVSSELEPAPAVSAETVVRNLGIRLANLDQRLELPEQWARFLPELRDEILAEPDLCRRAAYLFLFGQIVRALGSPDAMTDSLQELAPIAGAVTRSGLLDRLATRWETPDDEFFAVLERLERLDDVDEGSVASARRASIALERIQQGGLKRETRDRLRELLVPPETFPGLVVRAIESHAVADRAAAIDAWERLSVVEKGDLASASIALVIWLLQGTPGFFETADMLLGRGWNSRALLLLMQREAVRAGDRLQEARALKHLVGLDIKLGKKLSNDSAGRERLKQETAARLVRLSTLLYGLNESDRQVSELAGMAEYPVMRDAISLNPRNLHHLRKIERVALQHRDPSMAEKSLISQAALLQDPQMSAIVWERVAELARRGGAPAETVRDYLERSLEAAPDCLPALISLGQHIIATGDFGPMLALRAPGPARDEDMHAAWRRGELLERTGGDPMEILSLYRGAREDFPESVHLFFCAERALARIGDWRGLRTLYDTASMQEQGLGHRLRAAGFDLERYRLGVECFLEDPYGELSEAAIRYVDQLPVDGSEVDQNLIWRVIAREIDSNPGRAQGRLEVLLQGSRGETPWRTCALTWYARHLEDTALSQERLVAVLRELFGRAGGVFLQRWAARGLLRAGDAAWVAEDLIRGGRSKWMRGEAGNDAFHERVGAELLGVSSNADEALDVLERFTDLDEVGTAEVAERATVQAIRSRRWIRSIPWMTRCYPPEHHPALAEIARHLGASADDAVGALRYIDASQTQTPGNPYVILCELELAYRARDWARAMRLISDGLGTIAAGAIDFRAFLLEQAVLISEWGARSNEVSVISLEDLWSLGATVGSSPIFAVAAFLRTYTRMKRTDEFGVYDEFARANYTPSVAEALLAEPRLYEEAADGAAAAAWYAARLDSVPGPLQPYYRWMAATLGWMFGERDRKSVQDLADAAVSGDPTHRVGPFLLAVAYRHADMYASCERQLAVLRTPGHSRPVQDWVLVRQLFHLAVTQNQPAEALEILRQDDAFQQFGWYAIAQELFARATRNASAVPALRERARSSAGARALHLEIAEIEGDHEALHALAEEGLPEALAHVELRIAREEAPPSLRWDIDARWAHADEAAGHPTDVEAGEVVYDYLLDFDEELLGTPWCPLRLVRGDLAPFEFDAEELTALRDRFADFDDAQMGAEARLLVAREFLRKGRREDAAMLVPFATGPQLVFVGWSLFHFALDPYNRDPISSQWALDFWQRRSRSCAEGLGAEIEYEIARHLDATGRVDDAVAAYRRSLDATPSFLPSQVAAGRLLIQRRDWRGLASLWEAEMRQTEDADALASVAFRIGYLWERRLRDFPEADAHAEENYRRVLRVWPTHLPTLHALASIAYRNRNWVTASQYLEKIAETVGEATVRASYFAELGALREYHLEDLGGAREAYRSSLELVPGDADALFGLFRTDAADGGGAESIEAIRRRLQGEVTRRELRDLAHLLFGLSNRHAQASALLKEVSPTHYPWLLSRLVVGVEEKQVDAEAAQVLEEAYDDQSTRALLQAIRRIMSDWDSEGPANLAEDARVGVHPLEEGRLVTSMYWAWKRKDLEAQGLLAEARASRASSELLRSAETTWRAGTLLLRDEPEQALEICEELLERVPDFLPAVKVAKLAADACKRWPAVVRWYERDASMTRVSEVAAVDRLRASEVQRQHLGDFDAALEQLRAVLADEPTHEEAFAKLRDLLLTRQDFRALLEAYERCVKATEGEDARADLLNQMADVALNHLRDRRGAIGYLSRSLEIRPRQMKRLRVLSELYEKEERWDRAVVCHRAAAELSDDPAFLARLWRHVGQIYENKLDDVKRSRNAYARALNLDGEATEVLVALSRVCEKLGDHADASALLAKVLTISRDPRVLLHARISVARLKQKMNAAPAAVLDAIRDVLLHHPDHTASIDAARQALARAGAPTEVDGFFGKLTHDVILKHGIGALPPTFEMAMHLGQRDRAFCIASIGAELDAATQRMADYRSDRIAQRRWPSRPLSSELTGGVLPPGLVAPFMELLRLSRDAVMEGFEGAPGADLIKSATRLKEPSNGATGLAFQWPGLLGLELRDVHITSDVPLGSVVVFDGGVRMVLDEHWLQATDPTELVAALGVRLASWSMGVGPWSFLDIDTQVSLFIAVVSNYVRGWSHAERAHLPPSINYPRVQRWLEKKGQRVAPYAMEISGRFSTPAVRQQFELLLAAQKRIACVLVDDPGRALKVAGLLSKPAPGDRPPWLFILDTPASRIRQVVGIASK